jgi:hypothetical protein
MAGAAALNSGAGPARYHGRRGSDLMLATAGGHLGWLATAPQRGLSSDLLSSGLVAMGVMILVWFLLRMQWRRQGRTERTPLEHLTEGREAARSTGSRWAPGASPPTRASRRDEEAGAELVQLARRILAQIEARSAQLEALIADADDRIAELRRLEGGAGQRVPAARGEQPAVEARRATGGENGSSPAAQGRPAEDSMTREVYELADRGLPPVEIARELDQHLGAVELILALRPK